MSEEPVDVLRLRQEIENSEVRRLEMLMNDEWNQFQRQYNAHLTQLMEARFALWQTSQEIRALGYRPDDFFPMELYGFRKQDLEK